jgi:hypothetical protein
LRAAELHEAVSQGVMLLTLELPVFPHAVLYQQSLSAAAVVAAAAGAPSAGVSSAAAAAAAAAGSSSAGGGGGGGGPGGPAAGVADVIRFQDPEVRQGARVLRNGSQGVDDATEVQQADRGRDLVSGVSVGRHATVEAKVSTQR